MNLDGWWRLTIAACVVWAAIWSFERRTDIEQLFSEVPPHAADIKYCINVIETGTAPQGKYKDLCDDVDFMRMQAREFENVQKYYFLRGIASDGLERGLPWLVGGFVAAIGGVGLSRWVSSGFGKRSA